MIKHVAIYRLLIVFLAQLWQLKVGNLVDCHASLHAEYIGNPEILRENPSTMLMTKAGARRTTAN